MSKRLFLSCASREFAQIRDQLTADFRRPGVDVKSHEEVRSFNSGLTTLEKLDDYIKGCDAVVHLLGQASGAQVEPVGIDAILRRYPDLPKLLPQIAPLLAPGTDWHGSYTQWEAYLALYHRIPCFVFIAAEGFPRPEGFTSTPEERQLQDDHFLRFEQREQDRKQFVYREDLRVEMQRSLGKILPPDGVPFRRTHSKLKGVLLTVGASVVLAVLVFILVELRRQNNLLRDLADRRDALPSAAINPRTVEPARRTTSVTLERYRKRKREIEEHLQETPRDLERMLEGADINWILDDPTTTESYLKRAVAEAERRYNAGDPTGDKRLREVYQRRSAFYLSQRRYLEASNDANKGFLPYAAALVQAGRDEQAEAARGYHNLAAALRGMGNLDQALAYLNQAIAIYERLTQQNIKDVRLRAELAKALQTRAEVFEEKGNFVEARKDIDRSVSFLATLVGEGFGTVYGKWLQVARASREDIVTKPNPPVNSVPVANNDAYTTSENTMLTIAAPGVLANDRDVNGDPLSAVRVNGPLHGTLNLNASGAFVYTPSLNYTGADTFTYRASDGALTSSVATVRLTITETNSQTQGKPTRIGSETRVALPDSARYNAAITFQPGTNETVTVNPPVFSWPYMTNPAYSAATWTYPNQFQFQVAYDPAFTVFAVNKRVVYNFWNLIAPFTNNTVYWRVGYIPGTQTRPGTTTNWSTPRTLYIAQGATLWDRSHLATNSYVSAKMAHPFYSFRESDRAAYTNFLARCEAHYIARTGTIWEREVGYGWLDARTVASNAISSCWWGRYDPSVAGGGCAALNNATWADSVRTVAYVFQLTRWQIFSNAAPWDAVNRLAQRYLDGNWDQYANINLAGCCSEGMNEVRALATGYDWVYEWLSPRQRTNILAAIEGACQYHYSFGGASMFLLDYQNGANWRNISRVATNSVSSNSYVNPTSMVRKGTSHTHTEFQTVFAAAIAVYGDSSPTNRFPQSGAARDFFEFGVNWLIAKTYWAGDKALHQSRGYGAMFVQDNRQVQNGIILDRIFPEMQFARIPWYSGAADWLDKVTPPGYFNFYDPWGEGGGEEISWAKTIYRNWSFFLNTIDPNRAGIVYQHWFNTRPFYSPPYYITPPEEPEELSIPFYYPAPVARNSDTNVQLFASDGWVAGTTQPANTHSGYTNGLGLVFWARPYGGYSGAGSGSHSYCNDGNFDIWAYGAPITVGGKGNVGVEGQPSWQHNTIAVNGLGQAQSSAYIPREAFARIIAFTNSDNFAFMGADLTYAYPHDNVTVQNGPPQYNVLHNYGTLRGLNSMKRFILWPRKKYFVVYDAMQMSTNSTFSWVYHVAQTAAINTNACAFSYAASNIMRGSVTTYVAHVVNPSSMSLNNLTGTNVYGNPITRENYAWADPHPRKHAIWISNKVPAKNWHFMAVIYPVQPGTGAPQINRLDDSTVEVINGPERDVISFDPQTTQPATLIVDLRTLEVAPISKPRLNDEQLLNQGFRIRP